MRIFAVLLATGVVALLASAGTGEPGVREVIRWTARSSLVLLCLALASDGAQVLRPATRAALLRSLALSHAVHGLFVLALGWLLAGRNFVERSVPIDVFGGALAYVFMFRGALRPDSRWTSAGLVWIWGVFMVSYGARALRSPWPWSAAIALLVVAMLLRVSNAWRGSAAVHGRRLDAA